jgi:hypothetical protein
MIQLVKVETEIFIGKKDSLQKHHFHIATNNDSQKCVNHVNVVISIALLEIILYQSSHCLYSIRNAILNVNTHDI